MDVRQPFESVELPEDLHERIKSELVPGERLLWATRGIPRSSGTFSGILVAAIWAAGFLFLSALCFATFFGAFGPRLMEIEAAFGVGGLTCGMIGVIIVFGTLGSWVSEGSSRAVAAKRCYALTDRRAIVWNPLSGSKAVEVYSYPRGKIKAIHRVEYPDGSGDVVFGLPREENVWGPSGFTGIAEVRRIEDLVRRVLINPDSETGA